MVKKLFCTAILALILSFSMISFAEPDFHADINSNYITLNGDIGEADRKSVVIKAVNESNEILHIRLISTDAEGKISYTFEIDDTSQSGVINLYVMEHSFVEPKKIPLYYVNTSDREKVLNNINNAADEDEIKSLIETSYRDFGIDYSFSNYSLYANILYLKKPFSEYGEIKQAIIEADDLIDSLNNCQWSDLYDFLLANPVIVTSSYKYDTYSNMTSAARNKIGRETMLAAPFNDFNSFCSIFDKIITSESSLNNGTSGGGGGGGSPSGSASSGTYIASSSAISGSSHVSVSPTPAPIQTVTPVLNNDDNSFDDLDSVQWAKTAINELLSIGVISKAEDKKFRPNDDITREEFVKLIVCMLKPENRGGLMRFKDVSEGDWCASYIQTSVSNNLVNGYSDEIFGVGEAITRQDIATIIYRAAIMGNYSIPQMECTPFIDADEFADYAIEAINRLHEMGIISGFDGNFMPSNHATRAEAAQMLYNLYDKSGLKGDV